MTNEEKYYRRCYKIFEEINEYFKSGISDRKIWKFIYDKSHETTYNQKILIEKDTSLILTLLITLLGLNKEDIENEYNIKYKRNLIDFDILELLNNNYYNELKSTLEKSRIVNTDFDNWLYILKSTSKTNYNHEILKMVRNGLLHSNFNIDFSNDINIINVKSKNYFEANIIYQNFLQFIMSYFGNNIGTGLTTNNMLFIADPSINITDLEKLKEYLKELEIINIVLDNNDNSFYDDIFHKNRNNRSELDEKFVDELQGKIKSFNNTKLTDNQINFIASYINVYYNTSFYKYNNSLKQKYITELCNLVFNTKNYLSSWLLYIFDIFSKINYNGNPISNSSNGNICYEGFYISLTLLKSYLILYRLQSQEFIQINYDYIDIDLNKIKLIKNNNEDLLNIQEKYPDLDYETQQKMEIIQILRNALSHGNINILLVKDNDCLEYRFMIEFIDKYKDSIRKLCISLDELNKILNSKGFIPKYCYSNTLEKVKKI